MTNLGTGKIEKKIEFTINASTSRAMNMKGTFNCSN